MNDQSEVCLLGWSLNLANKMTTPFDLFVELFCQMYMYVQLAEQN